MSKNNGKVWFQLNTTDASNVLTKMSKNLINNIAENARHNIVAINGKVGSDTGINHVRVETQSGIGEPNKKGGVRYFVKVGLVSDGTSSGNHAIFVAKKNKVITKAASALKVK